MSPASHESKAPNALLLLFLALLVSAFLLPTSYHRAALQHARGQEPCAADAGPQATTRYTRAADYGPFHSLPAAPCGSSGLPPAEPQATQALSAGPGKAQRTAPAADDSSEINILMATGHDYADYTGLTPCSYNGRPLACRYSFQVPWETADALWFHLPSMQQAHGHVLAYEPPFFHHPSRAYPGQPFILMSLEPRAKFPMLGDPRFMAMFDYKMTYRLDSDVPLVVAVFDVTQPPSHPLPPFAGRKPAAVFASKNCWPANGRTQLVRELMQEHGVAVEAVGDCLHNAPEPKAHGNGSNYEGGNLELYSKYRVCLTMENSNEEDYVSEKVWHALRAGCVPVYLGAPNACTHFLPANDSVIWVPDYAHIEIRTGGDGKAYKAWAGVDALAREISEVLTNEADFEKYTAWRSRPLEQLSEGYRALLRNESLPHTRCRMCQLLAARKDQRAQQQQEGQQRQAAAQV